jgi:large subunit ribosomal protein L21
MYAVIRTGGKQYRVSSQDILKIEKLDSDVGADVEFDVLAVGEGETLKVGMPLVDGAKVVGKVLNHDRAKKVIIYKYKRRKNYRRKKGHRQAFTTVQITAIEG